MSTWRTAGLSYVDYSMIAARTLRNSLKANLREEAIKRGVSHITFTFWVDGQSLGAGVKPKGDGGKTA